VNGTLHHLFTQLSTKLTQLPLAYSPCPTGAFHTWIGITGSDGHCQELEAEKPDLSPAQRWVVPGLGSQLTTQSRPNANPIKRSWRSRPHVILSVAKILASTRRAMRPASLAH